MAGFSIVMMIGLLMIVFFICAVISFICKVIDYIFESMALMEMSKKKGYPAPGTAWIPIYQRYILGKLGGNESFGIVAIIADCVSILSSVGIIFLTGDITTVLLLFIIAAKIVRFVLVTMLAYNIYGQTKKAYAVVYTVLNVFTLGFLRSIFLFVVRKDMPKAQETIIEG